MNKKILAFFVILTVNGMCSDIGLKKGTILSGTENIKELPVQVMSEKQDCYYDGKAKYDIQTSRYETKLTQEVCKDKENVAIKGWLVDDEGKYGTKSLSYETPVNILIADVEENGFIQKSEDNLAEGEIVAGADERDMGDKPVFLLYKNKAGNECTVIGHTSPTIPSLFEKVEIKLETESCKSGEKFMVNGYASLPDGNLLFSKITPGTKVNIVKAK